MKSATLGILGGLGPMSGVRFCEMIIEHTLAETDQDHINFLLSSRADTPDRTAFIVGSSSENPAPVMKREVSRLIEAGAELIVIPCNTAHYFYREIAKISSVPILNIIESTVDFCAFRGIRRIGILATEGTVLSGAYKSVLESKGMDYIIPTPEEQALVSQMIYGDIKQGKFPSRDRFLSVAESLRTRGAETVVLGCTELSLLKREFKLSEEFTDSLEVLAVSAIRACHKTPVGFDPWLMQFDPTPILHS